MTRIVGVVVLIVVTVFASLLLAQAPSYKVTNTYNLGGEGRWDYVVTDSSQHRMFIARTDRVMVVDENDGKLLGEIRGIDGAHGTAVDARTGHGFATSGNDGSIVMFDLKTFAVLKKTPAAPDADSIIFDPGASVVLSFNGDAHSSTVVRTSDGNLVANIPLGGKPEYAAAAGESKVYANLTDTSEVVEVDTKKLAVVRRWSTESCKQPVSMAIDQTNHRLFSGCRSGVLAVSDYASGKIVATLPIGMGVDGTAYDPKVRDIYASSADGTLTVIHQDSADKYHVLETVKTPLQSRNLGLDPTTHKLFLPAADFAPAPPNGRAAPIAATFRVLVVERSPGK